MMDRLLRVARPLRGVTHRSTVAARRRMGFVGAALLAACVVLACPALASATTWTLGAPASFSGPADASSPELNFVGCSAPGTCTAVGVAQVEVDSELTPEVLAAQEVSGTWQPATLVTTGFTDNDVPQVDGIACVSAGTCIVVGEDTGIYNTTEGAWSLSESGGGWGSPVTMSVPANADPYTVYYAPTGVACASSSHCVAVGDYSDSSDNSYAMASVGSVSSLGDFTETSSGDGFYAVACAPATTTCTAAGTDYSGTTREALVQTETGGVWSNTSDVTTGSGSGGYGAEARTIACPQANQCTVAGDDPQPSERDGASLFTVQQAADGTWSAPSSLDSDGSTYGTFQFGQLSCISPGNCILGAGGGYEFYTQALIGEETDGTWSAMTSSPLPSDAEPPDNYGASQSRGVSCSGEHCDIVGWYSNTSGNIVPYAFTAAANLPASATAIGCTPDPGGTSTYDCTVTVSDGSGATPPNTPTGTVTVTAPSGTFSGGGVCTLSATATAGSASCSVTYTPSGSETTPVTITASYGGDPNFAASQGQTMVSVSTALTIHAAVIGEPATGSVQAPVTVTLSSASASDVTVSYATEDGTATTAHGDYTATDGTLTFSPGQTSATIDVPVNASGLTEDAGFTVVLSNPVGATIAVGQATVEITDRPLLTGLVEDRQGHGLPGVTVQLSGASGTQSVITSSTGMYSAQLPQGSYTVTPLPGDGRYVPQAGGDCTLSGPSCQVTMSGQGNVTADFAAALGVDSVTFAQEDLSTGASNSVPSSGTYDGNTVQVTATISNAGSVALSTGVSFGRAASTSADSATPLASAGAAPGSVTVPAGGKARVTFDWGTQGDAWTDGGQPDPDHIIRATTDLTPAYGQESITVRPKPVILVHGLNSDASTWAAYPAFLASVNPDWQGFAVGDGQAPGVMNTTPIQTPSAGRGNTILENAQQEAKYIQGVRDLTGAWHVDIVAHSMGGLISRQYIDSLMPADPPDSKPVVSHLVMLGTPNEGSPCAELAVMAEKTAVSFPMLQLTQTYMTTFNSSVTDRHGVPFSIAAGDAWPVTCAGPPGDSVVPVSSALWNLSDSEVVPGLLHMAMTGSLSLFDSWVVPHLAIGPDAGASPSAKRAHDLRSGKATRTSRRAARTCKVTTGTTPALSAAGQFSATPSGSTEKITVTAARSLSVSVLATGMGVTLTSPSGRVVERIAATSAVAQGSLFDTIDVSHPQAGRWRLFVRTTGGRIPVAYTLLERGASTTLTAGVTVAHGHLRDVSARLRRYGRGVGGSRVSALLVLPNGTRRTLRLRPETHHRGVYRALTHLALSSGSAPLEVIVNATAPGATMTTSLSRASSCSTSSK